MRDGTGDREDPGLLHVSGLSVRLGEGPGAVVPVSGVGFRVESSEVFALVGESGCGKSMTALTLMRLLPVSGQVTSGRVRLQGRDLLRLPEHEMRPVRGGRIGMIFQEPMTSLNPVLTVGQQVMEGCMAHDRLRGAEARERVEYLFRRVGIPDPARRTGEYPHQLSGGLKQRVMIAMALAGRPGLLVADEPTTALDVTIQAQVLELLDELRRESGMGIVLITHDLGVVAEIADRVAVMYAGEIVETSPVGQLFEAPAHPYTRALLQAIPGRTRREGPLAGITGAAPSLSGDLPGCRFAPRCPHAMAECSRREPGTCEVATGHEVRCHLYPGPVQIFRIPSGAVQDTAARKADAPNTDKALLEVRGLKVHFPIRRGLMRRVTGQVRAVDGVSFTVHAGRTLALVGESGCGKTTLGKGILRLVEPLAGSVRFDGVELGGAGGRGLRDHRHAVQIVFQDPYASLNPRMTVGDILEEGMIALGVGGNGSDRRGRIDELLDRVGLEPSVMHRYPHEFSGGQRQRIGIARALAVSPRLLICDEPTSALDVSVQAQILNLLRELQRSLDMAYLFITHDISVVAYMADEIAVMYLGRIVEQGGTGEILARPRHPYTRLLLASVPKSRPDDTQVRERPGGDPPSPSSPPDGCAFHPRCRFREPRCTRAMPPETRVSEGHRVRCFLAQDPAGKGSGTG